MGIMPVTGIPLPFMSYGGSATITDVRLHRPRRQRLHAPLRRLSAGLLATLSTSLPSGRLRVHRCPTCGRGSNRSWPGSRSPLATSGWSGGAATPAHRRESRVLAARLPRYLRDRAAQPGAADPLRDPERTRRRRRRAVVRALGRHGGRAAPRAACRCSRSTPTAPAGDFDVLAFNLSAELVYTNVLNCLDLAGVPVRAEQRRPEHPLVVAGGHCAFNPEPMADFVDAFVIGDGEEVVGEITEVIASVEARRVARAARACCASSPRSRACTCPRCTTSSTTVRSSARSARATPTCPRASTSARSPTSPTGRTRSSQLVPLVEVVHDRLNVEIFRGCTRGCRFCQAGMITRPVRERPEEQVRTMVQDGLRRTGYDEVALTSLSSADFSGIDGLVADLVNEQEGTGCVGPLAAVAARRRVHRRHRQRDPEGPPHRAHVRARGRDVAHPPGHQQAHHRGRPVRRGRRRVLAGLAAGEALLPHRRCRPRWTRTRSASPSWPATSSRSVGKYTKQASCTVSVGGFVPEAAHAVPVVRPERRRRAASARSGCCATRCASRARSCAGTIPAGDVRRGHRQPRRPPDRPRHRAGLARRRDVPGVERALRARPLARARWRPRGSTPTGTSPGTAPPTRSCRGTTSRPVCTRDFLWQDWQAALARARAPRLPLDALLRLRRVHRLRARARRGVAGGAGGREPGDGQDLEPRRRARRCEFLGVPATSERGVRCAVTRASRCGSGSRSGARCGSSRTATSPGRSSGRSGSSSCRSRSRRGSRPGPRSASGSPCRSGTRATPSTSTSSCVEPVDLDAAGPSGSRTRCRRGST